MNTIKVKFKSPGRRTMTQQVHGFEIPAPKPISGFIMDGGKPIAPGQLWKGGTVDVPPSGLFEVPDTQHNREKLRRCTRPGERWQMSSKYDPDTNKHYQTQEKIKLPAYYEIIDGTPIEEDLVKKEKVAPEIVPVKVEDEGDYTIKPKKKIRRSKMIDESDAEDSNIEME